MREIPPTAGLPLSLSDLFAPRADFARAAQNYLAAPHAGLACSGTACLVIMLTALHRLSGRRTVIVPAYTCPLVAIAVAHCGLKLSLCDLAPDSFDLDLEALATLCDEDTLAIVPTHLAGRVAVVAPVKEIAARCGAFVIEDAAQAFGAHREGRSVGLDGDAGFFSFAAGKGLSLYEGGLWVTRDAALATTFRTASDEILLRGGMQECQRSIELAAYALMYRPSMLPWAYGIPLRHALRRGDLPRAVGDVFPDAIPLHRVGVWRQGVGVRALQRLSAFQQATAEQAAHRIAWLDRLPGVRVFRDAQKESGVWPSLMLLMPDQSSRDAALARLWSAGLGVTRMFIHALPDYAYLSHCVPQTSSPNARDFAARSLAISNSPWLDDASFDRIVGVLQECVSAG